MNLTKIFRIAAVMFVATMGFASPSHAAVSAFFFPPGRIALARRLQVFRLAARRCRFHYA